MGVKSIVKSIIRVLFYIFLITLPFNSQAFLAGALFAKYHNDGVGKGIELWFQELESWSYMDQFSIPGAPSIWEYKDNEYPFFVPQLRSREWASKLGLTIPYMHQEHFQVDGPIDKQVAFDGAVRDVSCHVNFATEYWVYVSSLSMPAVFEWDAAFVQLLEYHEMHPLRNNTKFAHVDCAGSPFLCHIWQVQYPALMHFRIDEQGSVGEDVDPDAFKSPLDQLRPVEVRIFDLGLQQDVSPLPPGRFPSMLEQMRALITNDGAYSIEEEYYQVARAYDQFNNLYYFPACNREGSFLDYSSEFDNFLLKRIAKPVGLEGAMETVNGLAFLTSMLLATAFYLVANPIRDFWTSFLGQHTEADRLAERMQEREAFAEGGGLLGGAAWGFVDMIEDMMRESSAAESAEQPLVTPEKGELDSLFAGLRANISSILKGT